MNSIIRHENEGEQRWFYGGGVHEWKATSEDTGGSLAVFEDSLTRGKVTPVHRHPDSDEVVYVIAGELDLWVDGGEPRRVGPGAIVVNPRGVAHAFTVVSETARLLLVLTPGVKVEEFYRHASAPMDGDRPVDFRKIGEAAKATGATEILAPPPFRQ